jgi:uncharacterized protein
MFHRVVAGVIFLGGIFSPQLAQAATPAAIAAPIEQSTADCTIPTYATDRLVCSNAELSALDQTLARMLTDLPSQARGADNPWLEEQQNWFKRRSLCAFEESHLECARRAYRTREAEMDALASHADDGKPLRCPSLPAASRYTISNEGLMIIRARQGEVLVAAWPEEDKGWRPFVSYRWGRTKGRLTRQGDNTALTCRLG